MSVRFPAHFILISACEPTGQVYLSPWGYLILYVWFPKVIISTQAMEARRDSTKCLILRPLRLNSLYRNPIGAQVYGQENMSERKLSGFQLVKHLEYYQGWDDYILVLKT